jgi:hypothetical protein
MELKNRSERIISKLSSDLLQTFYIFVPFAIGGILVVIFHTSSLSTATTSLMWALSCFASGSAVGFLFGIPKILQTDKPADSNQTDGSYRQQVNTNLEQISDWLTKIIVGLGLINLTKIPPFLNRMAEVLTMSIGLAKENTAFALALIVYFTLLGFLVGYLSTRLFLAGAFSRADQTASAINDIKLIAEDLTPELLQQFILNTKTSTLIEGEPSYNMRSSNQNKSLASEESDLDVDEPEKLKQELARLNQDN